MENLFQVVLNYLWAIVKLIGLSILCAIPFFILIKIFKNKYLLLRKKKSVIFSLFIIIFILSYIILLLIYFLPILSIFKGVSFLNILGIIFYHLIRLLIINILISGVFLGFSFITLAFYDKFNEKKKQPKTNLNLIKSLILTNIIFFIILLIFPKLIAILIYLIYL